jgi:hypothetical protein
MGPNRIKLAFATGTGIVSVVFPRFLIPSVVLFHFIVLVYILVLFGRVGNVPDGSDAGGRASVHQRLHLLPEDRDHGLQPQL